MQFIVKSSSTRCIERMFGMSILWTRALGYAWDSVYDYSRYKSTESSWGFPLKHRIHWSNTNSMKLNTKPCFTCNPKAFIWVENTFKCTHVLNNMNRQKWFYSFKPLTGYSPKKRLKEDWILPEVCTLLLLKEDRTALYKKRKIEREREQIFAKTWRGVTRHPVTAWATCTQSTKHMLFSPGFVETDTQTPLFFFLPAPILETVFLCFEL